MRGDLRLSLETAKKLRLKNKKENRFAEIYKRERLTEIRYLGLQTIKVEQIIGSVNRWQDFDRYFRSQEADQKKLKSVLNALDEGLVLPPIVVYKIKDHYYIIDGNHRVVAAKMNKQIDIEAEVYELIPPADSVEHLLWRERSKFEWKVGISLNFTELGSYKRLLTYLRLYTRQLNQRSKGSYTLKSAAQQWYNEVYQPALKKIKEEKLMDCFPAHTADDLFLYVIHHQLIKAKLQGRKVDLAEAISDFFEAPEPTENKVRNLFKGFVFKKDCRKGCGRCAKSCPEGLICTETGRLMIKEDCRGCGLCVDSCPEDNLIAYEEF